MLDPLYLGLDARKPVLGFAGSHRLEKYVNLEASLEKSLKIKSALKSTENSVKSLEKSLNSTIFCRTVIP